jgi:tRNA pseudouridine55 synthase
MHGVLNINKPSGMTSHDVVQKVRRIAQEKRVGHTGTLDPLATGVLVLCVGKATRIAQYLEAGEKEYDAVMRLGVTTDTLDAEGRVLETKQYMPPPLQNIIDALARFRGEIMQQPPLFSAIKVGGIPSYKLARRGTAAVLAPRRVTIYRIDLAAYDDPFVRLRVRCSKGTYIRSLCADIGESLGMGAHLSNLVRTRSGRFSVENALSLERLAEQGVEKALVPLDEALADFPAATVSERDAERVRHGNPVVLAVPAPGQGVRIRVHDPSGNLLAIARHEGGMLRPEVVL